MLPLLVLIDGKLPTGCGKALEASLPDVAELEINLKPSPCLEELLSRLVLEPKRLTNGLTAQATEIINDTGFEHTIQGYCKNYLTARVLIHGDLRENETLFKKVCKLIHYCAHSLTSRPALAGLDHAPHLAMERALGLRGLGQDAE